MPLSEKADIKLKLKLRIFNAEDVPDIETAMKLMREGKLDILAIQSEEVDI